MLYISTHQALAVHSHLAPNQHLKPGGEHLLASALARPATSYADTELYPSIFEKAAALLEALTQNHPFTDGNKRTAYTCTYLFLKLNGWTFHSGLTNQQQADFVIEVASHSLTFEEITARIEAWSVPLPVF